MSACFAQQAGRAAPRAASATPRIAIVANSATGEGLASETCNRERVSGDAGTRRNHTVGWLVILASSRSTSSNVGGDVNRCPYFFES